MTELEHRVASSAAVQLAGRGAVLALSGVSLAVLTRYLSAERYGQLQLALAYLSVAGFAADLGTTTILVRELGRDAAAAGRLGSNALALRVLSGGVVLSVVALGAQALPYPSPVRLAILIGAVGTFCASLQTPLAAIFQARLRMGPVVLAEVGGRVAALVALLAVVWLDAGFAAVVAATSLAPVVALAVTLARVRREVTLRIALEAATARRLLTAGLPLGLALALNQLYFRADTFILSAFRSFAEVGVYTMAYRLFELSLTLPAIYTTSVFPLLAQAVARSDAAAHRWLQRALDAILVAGLPAVTLGIVGAPEIVALAGGALFREATLPLRVLLVAALLVAVNGLFGHAIIAKDRHARALWLNALALIFNVAANLAVIPTYGAPGAALTTAASEVVVLVGNLLLVRRHLGFVPRLAGAGRAAAGTAAMLVPVVLLGGRFPLLGAGFGALLYAAVVFSRWRTRADVDA